MSASIPPLRSDLVIEPREGDDAFVAVLSDPELGQRMKLDRTGLAVVQALDAARTMEELADLTGVEPELIERTVSFLGRLHLLQSDRTNAFLDSARAGREQQQRDPATVPLIIREDAAFSCTMCGSCCGGHNVGPVQADILEGLSDKFDDLADLTRTDKGLFFRLPVKTPAGYEEQVVCHSRGGSCIFLADDRRCTIHGQYGGDAKPRVCRLFPYQFIATPDGVAVSLQMECRGFVDARQGTPLKDQEADLRKLLALAPLPRVRPIIMLDGATPLTWRDYNPVEEALHAAVEANRANPPAALVALRKVVEAQRGRDDTAVGNGCDAASLAVDLDTLIAAMCNTCDQLQTGFHREDERHVVHTESLELLTDGLRTMRPEMRRVVQPVERADQRDIFVELVHHHIMGKDLISAKTMTLGLARLAFSWFAAKGLMIRRARQVKRRHLVAQDVLDAVVVVRFLLRNQDFMQAFRLHDELVEDLFYRRLPALVASGPELPDPDERLELYKF